MLIRPDRSIGRTHVGRSHGLPVPDLEVALIARR